MTHCTEGDDMKYSEIIAQINLDMDESYDNGDVIGWLNGCTRDLTPIAKKESKVVFPIVSSNTYTIPTDLHELHAVMIGDAEYNSLSVRDKTATGYTVWGTELTMKNGPQDGELEIYYYRRLPEITAAQLDQEPEIEPEFHDLYVLYGRAQMQFAEEEEEGRTSSMQLYNQRKREYAAFKSKRKKYSSVRVVGYGY